MDSLNLYNYDASKLFESLYKVHPLLNLVVLDFGIQWGGFILASIFHTEKFYDLLGSVSFITISYLNYKWHNNNSERPGIQTACVCIWALRLGLFLFTRILKSGKDRRFNEIKKSPVRFFIVWTLQGVWVLVTLLPTLLCVQSDRQRALGWRDYIGWSLWAVGLIVEVVADYQKSSFRNLPANKDKFINSGLWSFCRHPNYLGEIILWFGLYVSASSVFQGLEYLTVFSPVFVYLLITQVSGIPPLEMYAIRKWGRLPSYQEYLRKTPKLVPWFK